jgi:moderate conductance mechanosensitive channel
MSSETQATAVGVLAAFVIAGLVARLVRATVRRALARTAPVSDEKRAVLQERGQRLTNALTFLAFALAVVFSLSITLERFGVHQPGWSPRELLNKALDDGVPIVIILVGALVIIRAAHFIIERLVHRLLAHHSQADDEWQRRTATLAGILSSTVTGSVGFIAVLMVLQQLSLDVVPILTGAGIAGLAVGFGAQNLVRDVISGFFLILEDRLRIGDIVRINAVTGKVEQLNLRTTVLRDGDGAQHMFPNGNITALANLSKHFAYAVIDVKVAYNENLDRVTATLRETGTAMAGDPAWGARIMEAVEVTGVEAIDSGGVTVRMRVKTLPLYQGPVANELRRRIVGALVGRGIRPYAPF